MGYHSGQNKDSCTDSVVFRAERIANPLIEEYLHAYLAEACVMRRGRLQKTGDTGCRRSNGLQRSSGKRLQQSGPG